MLYLGEISTCMENSPIETDTTLDKPVIEAWAWKGHEKVMNNWWFVFGALEGGSVRMSVSNEPQYITCDECPVPSLFITLLFMHMSIYHRQNFAPFIARDYVNGFD